MEGSISVALLRCCYIVWEEGVGARSAGGWTTADGNGSQHADTQSVQHHALVLIKMVVVFSYSPCPRRMHSDVSGLQKRILTFVDALQRDQTYQWATSY